MSDAPVKVLINSREIEVDDAKIREHKRIELFTDIQQMKTVIDSFSSRHFVVVFLDEPDQCGDREEIGKKRNVETIICRNSTNNMPNLRNDLNIVKNIPLFKRKLKDISVWRWLSIEFYGLGQNRWGELFEAQAGELFQWLKNSIRLMVCHVLISPLNTNRGNLMQCQQAMIEKCTELFPGKEIRVCTCYDYFFFEEFDHEGTDSLDELTIKCQRELKDSILNMIPNIAPIRIYLVKDGDQITDDLVRLLITKKSTDGERKFEEICIFMEYERITKPEVKRDLAGFLNTRWLDGSRTTISTFHEIVTDHHFKKAVQNVYDAHPQPEDRAKVPSQLQYTDYYRSTSDSNESSSSIGQAQTCRIDSDEDFGTAMDTRIHREYQKSPEDYWNDKFEPIVEAQSGPRDQDNNFSTAMDTRMQRD